jgi:uroporphyrinogen III methyltransferase/synthase
VDLIAAADVVVLDQSSREDLVARHARDGVEILDAAFGDDGAPLTRAARAKLVVKAAKAGGRVVRLMDGDPTTFTGLMDEIAACRKAGVGFDVVPGVSAVVAVPTYAGVPMTTPNTSSVNIVHPQGRALDWSRHADKDSTLVVLGGGEDIAAAAVGLLAAGRNPATPVAPSRCSAGASWSRGPRSRPAGSPPSSPSTAPSPRSSPRSPSSRRARRSRWRRPSRVW